MAAALDDYPELAAFLDKEPAATLAIPIDEQGTIHIASLLYWHNADPLAFYFVTGKHTEKCNLLNSRTKLQGALVVGTYRGTPFTLQMRGTVALLDKDKHRSAIDHYYRKRGNHHDDIVDPDNVLLMFTPTWARYTDYSKGYKRNFLSLDGQVVNE